MPEKPFIETVRPSLRMIRWMIGRKWNTELIF